MSKEKNPVGRPVLDKNKETLTNYKLDAKDMIKWSELSRCLSGSEQVISKLKFNNGAIKPEYMENINGLIETIEDWYDKIKLKK